MMVDMDKILREENSIEDITKEKPWPLDPLLMMSAITSWWIPNGPGVYITYVLVSVNGYLVSVSLFFHAVDC